MFLYQTVVPVLYCPVEILPCTQLDTPCSTSCSVSVCLFICWSVLYVLYCIEALPYSTTLLNLTPLARLLQCAENSDQGSSEYYQVRFQYYHTFTVITDQQ